MKKFVFIAIAGIMLALPAMQVFAVEYTISENDIIIEPMLPDPDLSSPSENDIPFIIIDDDFDQEDPATDPSDTPELADFGSISDSLFLINETLSSLDNDISLLSDYSGISYSIPELYLTYMRDVLSWSTLGDNYVAFPSTYVLYNNTYTYYILVIGDITFSGSRFYGSDVDVYEFFPQVTSFSGNSNYRHSIQASFSFVPGASLCFTDLSSNYPNIRGTTNNYLFIIIVILVFVILFYTITKFGWGNISIRRRAAKKRYF